MRKTGARLLVALGVLLAIGLVLAEVVDFECPACQQTQYTRAFYTCPTHGVFKTQCQYETEVGFPPPVPKLCSQCSYMADADSAHCEATNCFWRWYY